MSMMTMNENRTPRTAGGRTWKSRFAAVALAALVVTGGAVAAPQAASAATRTCADDGYSCTMSTSASGSVSFRTIDSWGAKHGARYTVKTAGGTTLCSGTLMINGGWKTCGLLGYKGTVKITVAKSWSNNLRIITP